MPDKNNPQTTNSAAIVPVLVIASLMVFMLGLMLSSRSRVPYTPPATTDAVAAVEVTAEPTRISVMPTNEPGIVYSAQVVAQGSSYYTSNCSACHASNAGGVSGLGKSLLNNPFIDDMTDQELHDFIVQGRQPWDEGNTTGMSMPARGGNPALSDDNIYMIIAYIRSLNDPSVVVVGETTFDAAPMQERPPVLEIRPTEPFVMPVAPQYQVTLEPRAFNVVEAYNLSCAGCHGLDGLGVVDVNPVSLFDSPLLAADRTQDLFDFIAVLVPPANPEDGFPHPTRGEYAPLTDAQVSELIEYLYTLTTGR